MNQDRSMEIVEHAWAWSPLAGIVEAFDDRAGWGTLRTDDGHDLFFHCTSIADGTRTVDVGLAVVAECAPVGIGTWEATNIRPAASATH